MSLLVAASRCGSAASTSKSLLTRTTPLVQVRNYAAQLKKGERKPKPGRHHLMRSADGRTAPPKREKNPGAFRPMPLSASSEVGLKYDRSDGLDLPPFHPEAINVHAIGKVMKFPTKDTNPLQVFGVPKSILLEYRILNKPCALTREVTVDVLQHLDAAAKSSSSNQRFVLTGEAGCGKSFVLLQAVEYCASKNWIVLYIPRAAQTINSTSKYIYNEQTQTYFQPVYAYQTLQRLLTVNSQHISKLRTSVDFSFESHSEPTGAPLSDLIQAGLNNPASAPAVLTAVLEELGKQTEHPVLLAVDDFQALYCKTAYKDPVFASVKSYHLSMPRLLLEYASGKKTFARGVVLGAINNTDPLHKLPQELRKALQLPNISSAGAPVQKVSPVMEEYARGLQSLPVPEQLSLAEAAALYTVWKDNKSVESLTHDEHFLAKYSESSGNARAFVWKGLLASLDLATSDDGRR